MKLGDLDITIKLGNDTPTLYLGDTMIQSGDTPTPPHDYSQDYLTFVPTEPYGCTFSCTNNSISYSLDNGSTWGNLANDMPIVMNNEKMLVKASGITPTSTNGIGTFSSPGQFEVEGNIMSLVSGDNFTQATTIANYQFLGLFSGCTGLTSAENMVIPVNHMPVSACTRMFWDCSNLTASPALPATTLASTCYGWMFRGCSSLATAPALPATTLAQSCYQAMFSNATGLTTPPELPATTLATQCYQGMFYNTSITRAPELPATRLVDYCYAYMFQNCRNLNYIKALFTTTPSASYTSNWVDGVASTGTFVKNSAATWNVTGRNGVPSGWTVETASV